MESHLPKHDHLEHVKWRNGQENHSKVFSAVKLVLHYSVPQELQESKVTAVNSDRQLERTANQLKWDRFWGHWSILTEWDHFWGHWSILTEKSRKSPQAARHQTDFAKHFPLNYFLVDSDSELQIQL